MSKRRPATAGQRARTKRRVTRPAHPRQHMGSPIDWATIYADIGRPLTTDERADALAVCDAPSKPRQGSLL